MQERQQFAELLRLRLRVTWRTYTATFTARLESMLFLPAVLITAWGLHWMMYAILMQVYDPIIGWRTLSVNLVMLLHVALWALFAGWAVVPALGFRTNEALDLAKLHLLPVRWRTLFAASALGYGFDLSTLLPIGLCAGIVRFLHEVIPRSYGWQLDTAAWTALLTILGLFLLLLLQASWLVVQLFQTILPRVDLTRLLLLFFLAVLGYVVALNLHWVEAPDGTTIFDELFIDRYNALPTGPFALALHELAERNPALMWHFVLQGAGWVAILLAANGLLLNLAATGRCFGLERWLNAERLGLGARTRRLSRHGSWPGWVRHPALLVAWKDACTLLRNRHFFFYKTLPGILAPTIILLVGKYNLVLMRDYGDVMHWFVPIYFGLCLFIFVTQANLFTSNHFGFERDQVASILVTPVPRLALLQGKNLFLFLALLPDIMLIASLGLLLIPQPQIGHWLLTLGSLGSIAVLLLGLGNMTSVLLPYFTPLDRPVITLQGAVLVGLAQGAVLLLLTLLLIVPALCLAVPWLWWGDVRWYVLTLPLWAGWLAACWWGLTYWAALLMPAYEEWIQLRVRGVL